MVVVVVVVVVGSVLASVRVPHHRIESNQKKTTYQRAASFPTIGIMPCTFAASASVPLACSNTFHDSSKDTH